MWQLYEEYERLRGDALDRNDLLRAAAAELERAPLDPAYAVVVADEAQDMTRVGLRLLHALAGDRPNALLLVGDGEQAVYPVGDTLSETGIPVRGRGDVLRVNYRNTAEVLAVARELATVNRFDGDAAMGLRDVTATLSGGAVRHYTASSAEDHDVELVTALHTCPVAPGDIALLTSTPEAATHYRQVLHAAQIPAVNLSDYAGRRIDAVKVGTIRRAKGLEFRAVFLPGRSTGHGADEVRTREALVGLTRARDFLWTGSVVGV
jgi:superfamily I DNA/RNA helicase